MNSIKNRIYRQNGIIIIGIVFILESIFIFGVRNYYYNTVVQELISKANISSDFYNKYLLNEKIYSKAKHILENNEVSSVFYLQVFDKNAKIVIDSYGIKSQITTDIPDVIEALKGNIKVKKMTAKDTGQKIMTVSFPLYYLDNISGALRYIVCVDKLDEMVKSIIAVSLAIGGVVIIAVFILSSFLARGIICPVQELTNIAGFMAKGDFSKKAIKRNDDEIGKLADTLNCMADEIEKSNRVKNEFISSISHELRTPLTAILGWAEILADGQVGSNEEQKEGMEIIESETKRLSGIVEQLLDFSRLESGRISLDLRHIDLNDIIKEVSTYFKKRLEQEQVKLKLNLEKKQCIIYADMNKIKQVLINIIDNSIKFSKPKDKIYITTLKEKEHVKVVIKDEGLGISKEDLNRVTEKFYKGKTGKSGSGIGLAVCKEIVNLHKGALAIDSIKGKGTVVTIELPSQL